MYILLSKGDEKLPLEYEGDPTTKTMVIKKEIALIEACISDYLSKIERLPLSEQKLCAASLENLAQAASGAARGIMDVAEA